MMKGNGGRRLRGEGEEERLAWSGRWDRPIGEGGE